MGRIVLGIGTSHGPMLNTPAELWGARSTVDRANRQLVYRGDRYTFDELMAVRGGDHFRKQLGPDVWIEQKARCESALETLADRFEEAAPDVTVIFSSDHKEVFGDENLPGILVYWGESVPHLPPTAAHLATMAPSLAVATRGYAPATPVVRSCAPDFALHLINGAVDAGFDVAASSELPPGRYDNGGIPHGWGFVYRRIMRDRVLPNVPVFLNTFFPPNQPTPARCYDFGRALRGIVDSFDDDVRVAVVASGGLSHFVVEEDLDQRLLGALERKDAATLRSFEPSHLASGTSEFRSWLAVAGAMADEPAAMTLVDYVPCYRSEAGTGNAMGFTYWN